MRREKALVHSGRQTRPGHLLITKAEKADCKINWRFYSKTNPKKGNHDYYVSAAMVLRAGLQKGHKCADEPWD